LGERYKCAKREGGTLMKLLVQAGDAHRYEKKRLETQLRLGRELQGSEREKWKVEKAHFQARVATCEETVRGQKSTLTSLKRTIGTLQAAVSGVLVVPLLVIHASISDSRA
jgi:hypothetical protein